MASKKSKLGSSFNLPSQKKTPLQTAESSNKKSRATLAALGVADPTKKKGPSALERIFGPLDVLGTGARAGVHNLFNAASDKDVSMLGEMGKSLRGEKRIEGADLLKDFGVIDDDTNKWVSFILAMAVDVGLDPVTYLSWGLSAAAKHAGKTAIVEAGRSGMLIDDVAKMLGTNADDAARLLAERLAGEGDDVAEIAARLLKGEKMVRVGNLVDDEAQVVKHAIMAEAAAKLGDKGGMKFLGKTVIPMQGALDKASDIASLGLKTKPGAWASKAFQAYADKIPEGANALERITIPREMKAVSGIVAKGRAIGAKIRSLFEKNLPDEAMRDTFTVAVGRELGDVGTRRSIDELYQTIQAGRDELAEALSKVGVKKASGSTDQILGLAAKKLPRDVYENASAKIGMAEIKLRQMLKPITEGGVYDPEAIYKTFIDAGYDAAIATKAQSLAGDYHKLMDEMARLREEAGLPSWTLYGDHLPEGAPRSAGYVTGRNLTPDTNILNLPTRAAKKSLDAQDEVARRLGITIGDEAAPLASRNLLENAVEAAPYGTPKVRLNPKAYLSKSKGLKDAERRMVDGGLLTDLDIGGLAESKVAGDYADIAAQTLGEKLVAGGMDADTAKRLKELFSTSLGTDQAIKGFFRTFDKVQNMWKRAATAMRFPAFQNRNLFSDKILQAMKGVLDPESEAKATALITKIHTGKIDLLTDTPDAMHVKELIERGVVQTAEEFAEQVRGGKFVSKPARFFGGVNELFENQSRIASYYAGLKKGLDPESAARLVDETLYDYSNVARTAFEQSVMMRLVPFYKWCVPDDSEILTREGFKTHDELRVGEDVLTYSIEHDCMEWQPVQEIAAFPHDGDLHVFHNKRVKLRYTDGHRWVTRRRNQTVKHPYGVYHYGGEVRVRTAEELTGEDLLIISSEYHGGTSVLTPDQATLLGWLVTDGYHRWRGNHLECVLYQSPKKECFGEVVAIAGGKPRTPHPTTGVVCIPILHERVAELKPYFASKDDLPRIVGGLSREAADAMYDAMLKAEGYVARRGTNREHTAFSQKRGPVLDAFLMLCAMTGRSVTIRDGESVSVVIVRKRNVLSVAAGKRIKEHYTGTVWCPVTPNGTWVMRQDGTVVITGNTRQNVPNMVTLFAKDPGKVSWLGHLKGSGEALNEYDKSVMPDWMRDVFPIPLPLKDKSDNPVMLSTAGLFPQGDIELLSGLFSGKLDPKDAFGMLSPIIRTPLELLFNKDLWYGSAIEKYPGEKKRVPAYVERFGDLAAAVPGLDGLWQFLSSRIGIEERADDEGNDYYFASAKAMKALRDFTPWMNQISKVLDAQPRTPYDQFAMATGVKPMLFETDRFASSQVYDDRAELQNALQRLKDEGRLPDKPTVNLAKLFGGK